MQRDWNKPGFPGLFEASASGSVLKGETAFQGAVRELKEETGIESDQLTPIYRYVSEDTIYCGFLCVTNIEKHLIQLQAGETIGLMWLDKLDFLKFIDTENYVKPHRERLEGYLRSIE